MTVPFLNRTESEFRFVWRCRAVGTVVGGVVGYVAMLRPQSATNPYALTAILCTCVALGGLLTVFQPRVTPLPPTPSPPAQDPRPVPVGITAHRLVQGL